MGPEKKSDSEHEPTRSFDLDHHESVVELRALPDEEIERRHDVIMRSVGDDSVGDLERQIRIGRAHAYRVILEHRQLTRQGQRMEALTRSMNRLTWVVVLATIVGAGMTTWALLSGN
jgi:DNA polymerase II large subunit